RACFCPSLGDVKTIELSTISIRPPDGIQLGIASAGITRPLSTSSVTCQAPFNSEYAPFCADAELHAKAATLKTKNIDLANWRFIIQSAFLYWVTRAAAGQAARTGFLSKYGSGGEPVEYLCGELVATVAPASDVRPGDARSCVRLSARIDKTLSSTISPCTR